MTDSEKVALVAHLHVLMRRKTGRITDTEWVLHNDEYAREIIRLALADGAAELVEVAHKLEAARFGALSPKIVKPLIEQAKEARERASLAPPQARYVGSLR